jgi:hypothetical protein
MQFDLRHLPLDGDAFDAGEGLAGLVPVRLGLDELTIEEYSRRASLQEFHELIDTGCHKITVPLRRAVDVDCNPYERGVRVA